MDVPVQRSHRDRQCDLAEILRQPERDGERGPDRACEEEWAETVGEDRRTHIVAAASQCERNGHCETSFVCRGGCCKRLAGTLILIRWEPRSSGLAASPPSQDQSNSNARIRRGWPPPPRCAARRIACGIRTRPRARC